MVIPFQGFPIPAPQGSDFYKEWMGVKTKKDYMPKMDGATNDMNSPNKVSPHAMLAFFKALLDDKWIAVFKHNYHAVKMQISKEHKAKIF